MSISLAELWNYLNSYLQVEEVQDYCPNGIQIEGREKIATLATAVSASLATIEAAIAANVDALVVHHGLFWNKDPYPLIGAKQKKIKRLLEAGISLICVHLPLDMHREVGNNWVAARELGWQKLEPVYCDQLPLGVKGEFASCAPQEMMERLTEYYAHPCYAAPGGKTVLQKGVIISGAAWDELPLVASLGVDCFVTGNFDEPAWHMAAEEQIHFFAMGHSATERVGPRALSEHLAKHFKISCQFLDLANPF